MESLSEKQQRFSFLVGQLLLWVGNKGCGVTFGEAYRSDEQAAINALGVVGRKNLVATLAPYPIFKDLAKALENNVGSGIARSLHTKRLAIDLMLFKDGKYMTNSDDYKEMGEYWESLDSDCRWGGRFGDGNHFSLEHEGMK